MGSARTRDKHGKRRTDHRGKPSTKAKAGRGGGGARRTPHAKAPAEAATAPSSPARTRRLTLLLGLAILVAGLLVYLNGFGGAFLFDDEEHIHLNPHVKTFSMQTLTNRRRPVVNLTLHANYLISDLDPWSYHAFNIAVHLAAALALFGVVRRTVGLLPERYGLARAAPWLAFTVALLWVVHPLQTQSVSYVIQRGESLMGLLYLLTLYCVIRGAGSARAWPWYAAAIVACALGMGTKAVMVTAPLLVALYDRVFLAGSFRAMLRRRWGLYAGLFGMYAILGALGFMVVFKPGATGTGVGFGTAEVTWWEYFRTQPQIILHYLGLSAWPARLCLDYRWAIETDAGVIALTGLAVTALFVATLWGLKACPPLGYAGAWFFVILGPTSSFIPIRDLAFEHRMYLPLAAVIVVVVFAGHALLRRAWTALGIDPATARMVTAALVVAAAAGLGVRTIMRNQDYRSEIAMWESVIEIAPENGRAYQNLGRSLILAGRPADAMPHLLKAVEINPYHAKAHVNIGNVYLMNGMTDRAIPHYEAAAKINPDLSDPHTNLGALYLGSGEVDKAIEHLKIAVRLDRRDADARRNLGLALARRQRHEEAIKWYREAIAINPLFADAYCSLGFALQQTGDLEGAAEAFAAALEIDPEHPRAGPALEDLR